MNKTLSVVVAAFLVLATGFATAELTEPQTGTPSAVATTGTGQVLGVHHMILKPDVDVSAFEQFIVDEWAPVVGGAFPGIQIILLKGERNAEEGRYLMVYQVQSLFVRDYYFPTPVEVSDAANNAYAVCGARCDALWERFNEMVERTDWADYVELKKE